MINKQLKATFKWNDGSKYELHYPETARGIRNSKMRRPDSVKVSRHPRSADEEKWLRIDVTYSMDIKWNGEIQYDQ